MGDVINELDSDEVWWRDRYELFEIHRYRLCPRYKPGWVPSWMKVDLSYSGCEDLPAHVVSVFYSSPPALFGPAKGDPVTDTTKVSDDASAFD